MDIVGFDWETYYDDEYSLSKMTTEAYVRDPRFEPILCSIKVNDAKPFWVFPERVAEFVKNELDPDNTAALAHHAHFDGLILSHHFDWRPTMWLDTLSMARVIRGAKAGNSLDALLRHYGLREKGNYVTFAKGKHRADFDGHQIREYGDYSCNDIEGTYNLANIFLPQLPEQELHLIDMTIRMFTEPVFLGDIPRLQAAVQIEQQRRTELLTKCGAICLHCNGTGKAGADLVTPTAPECKKCKGSGFNKKLFTSNDQFADLLRRFGVEPETKASPTNGNQIYAFAKTDPAMQELQEHEDADIRDLAETRIAIKSNIIESRATRFISCAQRGPMPVYISHAGAHTLRPSGGDSMNWLNMSKHNENRPEMAVLKESIVAPEGYVIVDPDSSQGEARIIAWHAGQQDLLDAFAQGRDVYSEHATKVYGRPVDRKKVKADFIPGQVGKICILNMGFGGGWYTNAVNFLKGVLGAPPIQFTVEHLQALNIDPAPFLNNPHKVQRVSEMPSRLELNDLFIHCIVTEALVNRYRTTMDKICGKGGFWKTCDLAINAMIEGREFVFGNHGEFRTAKDRIYTPTGLWLDYPDIHRREDGEVTYFNGRTRKKIYGTLLCENLVQHFHRLIVADQMLEIGKRYKVALWTYDAVAFLAKEDEAEQALEFAVEVMSRTPPYAPGLPLASSGGYGKTLAEAGIEK